MVEDSFYSDVEELAAWFRFLAAVGRNIFALW